MVSSYFNTHKWKNGRTKTKNFFLNLKHLEIVTNAHSPKTRICQQIGPTGSSPCASPPSLKTNACWRSTLSFSACPFTLRHDLLRHLPFYNWDPRQSVTMQSWDHEELYLLGGIFVFQDTPEIMKKKLTDNFISKIPWSKRRRKRVCTRSWLSWPHICFFFSVDKSSCFMLNTNCFAGFGVTSKITSVGFFSLLPPQNRMVL